MRNELDLTLFGASHAEKIGVTINGLPKGEEVDINELQAFVDRRRASASPWSTPRIEKDEIVIESGLIGGRTTGEAVTAVIYNQNVKRGDYDELKYVPRPSHADYAAKRKFGIDYDMSGGGEFSGRMTAPLCIAGGIAKQILARRGIEAFAYVSSIGSVTGRSYRDGKIAKSELLAARSNRINALTKVGEMINDVENAAKRGDSVGGSVECVIFGAETLGGALYGGVESEISRNVFAIPAVKAVEFGLGVDFSGMTGSEVNDCYAVNDGKVEFLSNNNGGILGGIAADDVCFRATFKPTPSIALPQKSVNLKTMENVVLEIKGRHDACIVPRAVAAVEAAASIAMLNLILR